MTNPEKPIRLWVEEYRPRKISDIALPTRIMDQLIDVSNPQKMLPNMIFSGGAGCGKTTAALAIAHERGMQVMFINGSLDGTIDTVRTSLRDFASTASLDNRAKVVIFDEADYLSPATQPALRGFLEEFSENCRFIFTCNYPSRLIEPLFSRCRHIDFRQSQSDLKEVGPRMYECCEKLLRAEGIEFSPLAVKKLIASKYPDFRRVIMSLQVYSQRVGSVDSGVLVDDGGGDLNLAPLIGFLRERNFKSMRDWVSANLSQDMSSIYRRLYDSMYDLVEPDSIPSFVLLVHEYLSARPNVADEEISVVAFLTNVMIEIELKGGDKP
jgi:DNA polymerase III delta prime subunit